MGHSFYSTVDRSVRVASASVGYYSKSVNEIFTQNQERRIHESMSPTNVVFRESCDSVEHPNTVPIGLFLDVTGSMGKIPHEMIKDGLPTLVGSLVQNGIPDVALMFGAIGDHECDHYPLQVAQFESGDVELDMWLTRTYLEGGGGGNAGESYLLAWYFMANHVKTDAFDKRGKKGYLFTIGDEPTLKFLPSNAIKGLMNESAVCQNTMTAEQLLAEAKKKFHVYHIHIAHNYQSEKVVEDWRNLIGENLIVINNHKELSSVMSKLILSNEGLNNYSPVTSTVDNTGKKEEEIIL